MKNPYWDAVSDHIDPTGSLWRTPIVRRFRYDADPSLSYAEWRLTVPQRETLVRQYSWTVTDPATVAFVASHAHGGLVDPMAGTGYWAHLLDQCGVDVVNYDVDPGGNQWHTGVPLHVEVTAMPGVESVAKHPDRTLFLSWPPYDSPAGVDTLRAYAGSRLILIAEGEGGCVGNDALFTELDAAWAEVADHTPVQWDGMHDRVTVHARVPRG
jgi:hypothetical protein